LTILPLERWVLFADGLPDCLLMLCGFDRVLHTLACHARVFFGQIIGIRAGYYYFTRMVSHIPALVKWSVARGVYLEVLQLLEPPVHFVS
jgi:hypothetical protein